jgi:hypothetical protein
VGVLVHIQAIALILASVSVHTAAHPNDSIAPERVPATRYGLNIKRAAEQPSVETQDPLPVSAAIVDEYVQVLLNTEISGGAYSAELSETLVDLGRASQSVHKHAEAIDYFRRGLHLMRINEGLYSDRQLPALAAMIDSQLVLGRLAQVDENRNYRYRTQQRVYEPGGADLLQATLEYSEWQREAYLDGLGGDTYKRLLDIHTMHSRNIEHLEQINENDLAVIPILYQRMRAEYLLAGYTGEPVPLLQVSVKVAGAGVANVPNTNLALEAFKQLKKNNFRNGLKTLERIVALLEMADQPDVQELVRAKVALGDWYMWWNKKSRALQNYEAAYALRASDGESITKSPLLFREPVELPVERIFQPGPITPDTAGRARAVVRFDVSRVGQAREINIIELEPAGSMGARVTLFHVLRALRFRPLIRDGKAVSAQSIVREYKFDY